MPKFHSKKHTIIAIGGFRMKNDVLLASIKRQLNEDITTVRAYLGSYVDDVAFRSLLKRVLYSGSEYRPYLFAATAKISNSTLLRWVNGVSAPNPRIQQRYIRALVRVLESERNRLK